MSTPATALGGATPLLGKLLPRLGSDHDGEVVAAARAIARHLHASGFDSHDLTRAAPALPAAAPEPKPEPDWWDAPPLAPSALTLAWKPSLMLPGVTSEEACFVSDLSIRLRAGGGPSPDRLAWLRAIYARVMGGRRACRGLGASRPQQRRW